MKVSLRDCELLMLLLVRGSSVRSVIKMWFQVLFTQNCSPVGGRYDVVAFMTTGPSKGNVQFF